MKKLFIIIGIILLLLGMILILIFTDLGSFLNFNQSTLKINRVVEVDVFYEDTGHFTELLIKSGKQEGEITYDLSMINFNQVGEYDLKVSYFSNRRQQSINVLVIVVDRVAPVIKGTKNFLITTHSPLPNFLEGVTAEDNYDQNLILTVDDSQLNLNSPGYYTITYTVFDSSNNKAEESIHVKVVISEEYFSISYKGNFKVVKGNHDFNYYDLINHMTTVENDHLEIMGYYIRFNDEQINYNQTGRYPLLVNLFNDRNEVVYQETIWILIVNPVEIIFKNIDKIPFKEPSLSSLDLIDKLVDFNGNEVNEEDYLISYDHEIDTYTLGEQKITFTIKDSFGVVLTEQSETIYIVYAYDLTFDQLEVYYNTDFDVKALGLHLYDYEGNPLDLSNYQVTLLNSIDTTILGNFPSVVVLTNKLGEELHREEVIISVNYAYEIEFKDDLYLNYGDTLTKMEDFIVSIDHKKKGPVELNKDLLLQTSEEVNPFEVGTKTITLIFTDALGKTVYQTTKTVEVSKTFTINYKDNFNLYLAYTPEFNYMDSIDSILDSRGHPIEIGGIYKIVTDGMVLRTFEGIYPVTYSLCVGYDDEILSETKTFKVYRNNYNSTLIKAKEEPNFFKIGEYTAETIDYSKLVNVYDYEGNLVNLEDYYTIQVWNTTNFYASGTYYNNVLLFDLYGNQVDSAQVKITIYNKYLNINVNPTMNYTYEEYNNGTFDVYDYVESVSDLSNFIVTVKSTIEPSSVYPMGAKELAGGYILSAAQLDLENPLAIYFVVKDQQNHIYAVAKSTIHLVDGIYTKYKQNYNVALGDTSFSPLDLITKLDNGSGQPLIIGKDIFVEVENFDVNKLAPQMVQFTYRDQSSKTLLVETVMVNVISRESMYFVLSNRIITIKANDYTADTFDLSRYLFKVINLNNDEEVYLDESYQISYIGTIDFTKPGTYSIRVILYDQNNLDYDLREFTIIVNGDLDIVFKDNVLQVSTHESFDPINHIHHIKNFDESIHALTYSYSFDTKMVGFYIMEYFINDKATNLVLYREQVIVEVYIPFTAEFITDIEFNEENFNIINLIKGVYDRNGNLVNVEELGYHFEAETNLDILRVGYYDILFKLYDEKNQLIYTVNSFTRVHALYELIVQPTYTMNVNQEVDPVALVSYGQNLNTHGYIYFGTDYHLSYEGPLDTHQTGRYDIYYNLTDSFGKLLHRQYVTFYVVDPNSEAPKQINVGLPNRLNIPIGKYTSETFDLKEYITSITDEFGNSLEDVYEIHYYSLGLVKFNAYGVYFLNYSVYHIDHADKEVIQGLYIHISPYYEFVFDTEIQVNENFDSNQLILGYKDETGNLLPFDSRFTIKSIKTNLDPTKVGTYRVEYEFFDRMGEYGVCVEVFYVNVV